MVSLPIAEDRTVAAGPNCTSGLLQVVGQALRCRISKDPLPLLELIPQNVRLQGIEHFDVDTAIDDIVESFADAESEVARAEPFMLICGIAQEVSEPVSLPMRQRKLSNSTAEAAAVEMAEFVRRRTFLVPLRSAVRRQI